MSAATTSQPSTSTMMASGPAGMTSSQMRETVMRFQQMRSSGTPATDPEYQAVAHRMKIIQAHKNHLMNQQAYQQQMQQQKAANISQSNGNPANVTATTPQPTTATIPPVSSTAPSDAVKKSAPNSNQFFSPQQITTLKHQIVAFKALSKNQGIPIETQQLLFPSLKSQLARPEAHVPTPVAPHDSTAVLATAVPSSTPAVDGAARRTMFESFLSPLALLSKERGYKSVSSRVTIPSLSTPGVDIEQLREERELIILNRMSARYAELTQVASNLAHVDVGNGADPTVDDTIKKRAIIEMKKIELYAKQQSLRTRIGTRMIQANNLAMTANRTQYRRVKKQSLREARITEKLEKQQRDARQVREKKQHNDYITSVLDHRTEIANASFAQKAKMAKFGRLMQAQHQNIEKEEQKRIERTAKQRLAALKSNDEEAYLKLLDQAKDTRITHLLKQTDGFLSQLAASVKAQQKKAAIKNAADDGRGHVVEEESEDDDDDDDDDEPQNSDVKKIDYYAVAHKIEEKVVKQADMLTGGTLKEYQIKGLEWMISLYNNNLNGILADEMGLGKTIQTISLITYLVEKKRQPGPFLVIVPLSTLTNWTLEFEKWAPELKKIVYKGPPLSRKNHQEQIRRGDFNVLLTTYEYIIKDRPVLSKIKWIHMIIDEGHRMKNAQSKLSGTLTTYYHTRYRLILTGTPLQNNLPELWALLNFVLPTIFKSVKSFDEWFNTPFANTGGQDKMELTEEEQILVIRRLHKVLRPFLLRRLKKDVEKDLPDKTEKVIKCKFSALQARLYKQMVTHNKLVVSDGKGGKTGARGLSNMIMQLRKLCNHPFVFDEVENEMNPTSTSNDLLWRTSGKFELLDRILPKYQATGHRVLMFFQMTAIMDIMEDFLRYRNIKFMRLDGTTKSDDRSDLLRDFNAPGSEYFIFLLSTRAGGLGLNLQTADTVIIYDSDWNPHQDLQAQDRAHRIGQKNEVRILRLITSSSVEEKILERAKFKLDMDGKVIQAGRFDNKSSENDRDAMLRVMLETAEAAETLDQDDMDDEEMNLLLARSDAEIVKFREMDEARARDPTYGDVPGSKRIPRLMQESELPEIYMSDGNPISDEPEEIKGRGARERTRVKYDDGLTEEQWLNAVDDDDDSPEAAAARKAARKERRQQKKAKRQAGIADDDDESDGSVDSDATPEPEPVEKPKGRGRKSIGKVEKRKAEVIDEEPPPKKPRRGGPGRPKGAKNVDNGDFLTSAQRSQLQKSLIKIVDALRNLESDSSAGSDGSDDKTPHRQIIVPFLKLPHKKFFADYYMIIKEPISIAQIEIRIKKKEYKTLDGLKADIELLARNAKTYNEDSSVLFADAQTIENACNSLIREELNDHPILSELSGKSNMSADASEPTTTTGSPRPGSSTAATGSSKLKLSFKNTSAATAGVSADQSEDEED